MKKLKRGAIKKSKASSMPAAAPMMDYKPKPVSIHLHAEGEHLQAAHKDLARQLKPMGFTMKKKKSAAPTKSIGDALSS